MDAPREQIKHKLTMMMMMMMMNDDDGNNLLYVHRSEVAFQGRGQVGGGGGTTKE